MKSHNKMHFLREQSEGARVGGLAGKIFSLVGIILSASIIDAIANMKHPGAGAGASLTIFIFFWLPWLGRPIGAATGRITVSIIYQLGYNPPAKLCGAIGGGIAGVMVGSSPYVLLWLWALASGSSLY